MSTSFPTDTPAKKVAEVDLSGRELGQFRLLRRLGRGAMADVYLAEQSALKRWVAIKILKPELANDKVYLKRFEREAQAAASLVHANIVQIHEVGHVDNYRYIVQEYVQGQNLREYLSRSGPPDLPHTLSIMCQVVAALAKAAERGVVHRDIKPENIMLTRAGEVKVADFGLARVSREGEAADLTQVGITMGTPLYMSPEQVEGKLLDPRSDVYSFGVTCYHMLSGSPPFSGETALGVAVQHLKAEPQRLEIVRPDLPPALCRVVHKMLAKSPKDRYQSARELLRELRRLQLEQCGDNWPEDLPGWESVGFDLPDDPRISTARQLDGLMKTLALVRPRRRPRQPPRGPRLVRVAPCGSSDVNSNTSPSRVVGRRWENVWRRRCGRLVRAAAVRKLPATGRGALRTNRREHPVSSRWKTLKTARKQRSKRPLKQIVVSGVAWHPCRVLGKHWMFTTERASGGCEDLPSVDP